MIFKKKIAANLEEDVINLINNYKKDLEIDKVPGNIFLDALNMIGIGSTPVLMAIAGVSIIHGTATVALTDPVYASNFVGMAMTTNLGFLGLAAILRDYRKTIEKNDKIELKEKFENNINSLLRGLDEKDPAVTRFLIHKEELDDIGKKLIEFESEKLKSKESNNIKSTKKLKQ